jgi:antitoxin CcdA
MAMHLVYDPTAPKKATNLSCNSDLLRQAREIGVNLSAVLEGALEEVVRQRLADRWLADNREAIDSYNRDVEAKGVFSDGMRTF